MFCISPIIKFKLGKNLQRDYPYTSIWVVILVYTSTSKPLVSDHKNQ